MNSYVLAIDEKPIGLLSGPSEDLWPWTLIWNAPWGQHEIVLYVCPGCDPGCVGLATVSLLLEAHGFTN